MKFKHSFGIIVHNGASFVGLAIQSVYDVAHEIIVIEGCEPEALFLATPDGLSVDGTENVMQSIADPAKKIVYIRGGKYRTKTEQCNEYMKRVTGDFIWELDSDELYTCEDVVRMDALLAKGMYEAVEIPFWHFWRDTFHVARGTSWEIPIRRIFKFQKGDLYKTHRPPEICRKPWAEMKVLPATLLRQLNLYCFHYGFIENHRTKWKVAYHCNRGRPWRSYFQDHWIGNTGRHYNNLNETKNQVEEFTLPLPKPIMESKWSNRKKISVLHVLPSWSGGGGCTCVRDLIYSSNLGYFNHGMFVSKDVYRGQSPLIPSIPFYNQPGEFEKVARQYDVLEFMFWHSTPELTAAVRMKKPRPKIVVIIPIYNTNSLRMYFDRFNLSDEEKKEVDRVVFMTDKAYGLAENNGVRDFCVNPWGPDLIWCALDGFHWRRNPVQRVGYVGPYNHAVTNPNLVSILKAVKSNKVRFEMIGGGELEGKFKTEADSRFAWIPHLPLAEFEKALCNWDIFTYPMKDMCYCGSEMKIQQACASFTAMVVKPSIGLCDMGLEDAGIVCKSDGEVPVAIDRVLSDTGLKMELQQRARVHALKHMGAHTSTAKMEEIYQQIVGCC